MWTSEDLGRWVKDDAATTTQTVEATTHDGVETVVVTLSGAPPPESKRFVRVMAE